MSKTTQYLLGAVAIIGGSLYVYDQRSKTAVLDYEKLRHKGHVGVDKVADKAVELQAIGQNKSEKISEEFDHLKNKASNKLDSVLSYVQDKQQDVDAEAKKAKNKADGFLSNLFSSDKEPIQVVEQKDPIRKAGAKYVDAVNELGELTAKSLGVTTGPTAELLNKSAEKEVNSWFNWGSAKTEESKKKAVSEYEDAKKQYDQLKSDVQSQGSSWASWGKEKSAELAEKQKKQLEVVENKLKKALSNLKQYGNELYTQLTQEIPYADDKKLAERSANNLRGWGESAAQFAQEELDTLNNYKNKPITEVNWADEAFNKLKELSQYAQEQSQKKYDEIKAEFEKQKKATGGWFSKKNEEAEKKTAELQKKLDEATAQFDQSRKNAQVWATNALSDASSAAADATASTIAAAKGTLEKGHESVQSGLTLAKKWADEKK